MYSSIVGIVLAGGQSRRIGLTKALLPLGESTIIDHVLTPLREVTQNIWIITNAPEGFRSIGLPIAADIRSGCGALGGIYTGLSVTEAEYSLVLACDMPFVSADFLSILVERRYGWDVVIPRGIAGYEPLCAIYSKACLAPICEQLDQHQFKIADLLSRVRTNVVDEHEIQRLGFDGWMFYNINTQAEYEQARSMITSKQLQVSPG